MADISLTQAAVIKNLLGRNEGRVTMVSGVVGEDSVYLYSGEHKLGISFVTFSRNVFLKIKATDKLKKGDCIYFMHDGISSKVEIVQPGSKIGLYRVYFPPLNTFTFLSITQNPCYSINVERNGVVSTYKFIPGIQYDNDYDGALLIRNIARLIAETRTMLV